MVSPAGPDGLTVGSMSSDPATWSAEYRAAVVDLIAFLAYGELTAFHRIAADAALAPRIADQGALAEMAVAEFRHFTLLRERLADLGVDPDVAMAPFRRPLDEFHAQTAPSDWLEGMVKA